MADEDEPLASEEDVEEVRDDLTAEALALLFIAAVVLGDSDDESVDADVARWAAAGTARLANLYLSGVMRLANSGKGPAPAPADSFEIEEVVLPPASLRQLTQSVKAMRHSIREAEIAKAQDEPPGHHVTPEAASRAAANELFGIATTAIVDEMGRLDQLPGTKIRKTWVTRQDSRVRPLHARLNWQSREMGKDFWRWPSSGQALGYPGDPRAPLDATANCRCFLLLTVPADTQ